MPTSDELKSQDFEEYLDPGEKLLYAGHGQTGSTIGLSFVYPVAYSGWTR